MRACAFACMHMIAYLCLRTYIALARVYGSMRASVFERVLRKPLCDLWARV